MHAIQTLLTFLITSFNTHYNRARQSATVGASTIEYILMALLGITIAGIVAAGVTIFVNGKVGELGS